MDVVDRIERAHALLQAGAIDEKEFATLKGSFGYTLQIVLQRQYNFDDLTVRDLWTSAIWVWSLMVLVVMVVMNIVLAMVFDTFGEVRAQVANQDTLWSTAVRIGTQLRQ